MLPPDAIPIALLSGDGGSGAGGAGVTGAGGGAGVVGGAGVAGGVAGAGTTGGVFGGGGKRRGSGHGLRGLPIWAVAFEVSMRAAALWIAAQRL
jgi:hypothetical protein